MRALMLNVPNSLLEERRLKGLDRFDEMWEGVLHLVPPPSFAHQKLGAELLTALKPLADALGLSIVYETGLFRDEGDYRIPDLGCTGWIGRASLRGAWGRAAFARE